MNKTIFYTIVLVSVWLTGCSITSCEANQEPRGMEVRPHEMRTELPPQHQLRVELLPQHQYRAELPPQHAPALSYAYL
ncbi:hypothetical protein [Brevibacillus dissolubilis]|uniref:hypothetical protein n=1 Tax=Brevibacillus dissolubilis TaxID=1844116 RepID=UPI0011169379|nr:hypothetical protein [Brevibacillus dissolubilis]